jgi:hypothetical protein
MLTEILNEADLEQAISTGCWRNIRRFSIRGVEFRTKVEILDSQVAGADFSGCRFHQGLDFTESRFTHCLSLANAVVDGPAILRDVTFGNDVDLTAKEKELVDEFPFLKLKSLKKLFQCSKTTSAGKKRITRRC